MGQKINIKTRLVLISLLITGVLYFAVSLFLHERFLPNTIVNGCNVSFKTKAQAEKIIKEDIISNYSLEIKKNDGNTESIFGSEIKLDLMIDLDEVRNKQISLYWLRNIFLTNSYHVNYSIIYDENLLEKELSNFSFLKEENMIKPMDAHISDYINGKGYIVVEEIEGNYINESVIKEIIKKSIYNLDKELDLSLSNCYVKPDVTKDSVSLKEQLEKMNQAITSIITYDFDTNEIILDADTYHTWLSFDKDRVSINEDAVASYIEELSKNTDTAYTERAFKTTALKEVTINGPYGFRIAKNDERAQLIHNIQNGDIIKRKPVYTREGAIRNENDYGNTYIEVDLNGQKVYLYVDGVLIQSSSCVTGNLSKNYATPSGIYPLTYKQKDAVLRGPGYASPVKFWMPFHGGIGLHDASWRSTFGGNIYQTSGSHGCINLPYEMAKTLYENVYAGIPVICYN